MLKKCFGRPLSITRPATVAAVLTLAGCGGETLHDDSTGYVDMLPFFRGGGTTADPTAGIPRVIAPTRGWANGLRVEYYDFGTVTVPRKRGTRGEALRIPDYAPVAAMYFFYDRQGRPLFSKPAFDARTGVYHIRGGKDVQAASPISPPDENAAYAAYYRAPYVTRPRPLLMDPDRISADYQRPVIEALPDDADYTGLWEVVEITVKDSEYELDDIKSARTVEKGLESGKLSENRTGKVINCPVVDERTQVLPSAMAGNIPRPRIEVWYRTKLGNCFLANGWETIGEVLDTQAPASDLANIRLFRAGIDQANRVETIDVLEQTVGQGEASQTTITAPIAKLYVPTVTIPLQTPNNDRPRTRYPADDLAIALPRRSSTDAGGYSPIVWMHDLNVPQDPPYQPGTFKNFVDVDAAATEPRDGGTTVVTRNIAIIGVATPCTSDAQCRFGQQCNTMPDQTLAITDPPPGQNLADVVIQREGGPRCDVPATGFGGFCSPGVARCDVQAPVGSENEKALKALGVLSAGPTFTIHADLTAAEKRLSDARSLAMGVDPAMPTRMVTEAERTTAEGSIAGLESSAATLRTRVQYYDERGFTKDFAGFGYLCYPGTAGGGTASGFCQIRCDSTASSTVTETKVKIPVQSATTPGSIEEVDYTFRTEPRCGGTNMLGYRCLPSGTLPERQRVCVRECNRQANTSATYYVEDPAPTLAFNSALCDFPLNLKAAGGNASTALQLSGDLPLMSSLPGQSCVASSLSVAGSTSTTVRACLWNPDFVPRDPGIWPGQL